MRAAREAPFAADSDPPRLVQQDEAEGALLGAAQRGFAGGLDEAAAWQRFQRRKNAAIRWSLGRFWWLAPAVAALTLFAVRLREERATERQFSLVSAEGATSVVASAVIVASPPASVRRIPPVTSAAPAPARNGGPPRIAHTVMSQGSTDPPPRAELSDEICRRTASDGKIEQAVSCFATLGHGSGLGADVALYEAARLSAERLHDPARALALLGRHAQQFPSSALRGEAAWLGVLSLERTGQLDSALSESERLLASSVGRALSARIHLLRGRIYRKNRGDCAHAVQEYVALLGEPGENGDEAELGRAECLEQLGQARAAISAYERYLQRTDPRESLRANARLTVLRSNANEGASP